MSTDDETVVYVEGGADSIPGLAEQKAGAEEEESSFRKDSTAAAVERLFAASGIHSSVRKEIL